MASKKCLICNTSFSGRRDAKTCSARCRKRLQKVRYSFAPDGSVKRLTKVAAVFAVGLFGALSILLALGAPRASAATNNYINFQARLLNSSGTVVPDGNYHIEFKIYNTDGVTGSQGVCSGSCLWRETRSTGNLVKVVNGYFSVSLGSINNDLPGTINWDQQLYLTMRIGGSGGSPSWDGEMQNSGHSIALTGVPYAFRAGSLASFNGTQTGTLSFGTVTNSPVLTLPNETGTICSTGSVCTGYAPASGSGSYVQLQGSTPGSAQTGNFNISGSGVLGLLSVGGTGKTAISLSDTTTTTGMTIGGDTNLYRLSSGNLKTDNNFRAGQYLEANTATASRVILGYDGSGTAAAISFGSSYDTNLYRSAADTLKTDDTLQSAVAFQGPSFDTASGVGLSLGQTNATAINIGKTTSNITTTVNGLFVYKPTTGNDSTTAFQVQNAAGTTTLLGINTAGNGSAPTSPGVAAGANSGGTLSGSGSTTYYYKVSAIVGGAETPASSEVSIAGSSFTPISAPGAANTPTAGSAGNVSCNNTAGQGCKYEVTFVTANGETTAGTATASLLNITSKQINLTGIPTGPAGTTARNVYRSTNGGAYAKVNSGTCVLANNSTTSCVDNVASPSGAVPGSNTARTNLNNAIITFSSVSGATGYRVYRSTATGNENYYQAAASSPFTDTGAIGTNYLPDTAYSSRVQFGSQSILFKPTADSTTAFQIQNAAGTAAILTADTSGGQVLLGTTGTGGLNGKLVFNSATVGNYTVTLVASGSQSASYSLTLPTSGPALNQCLQNDGTTIGQLTFGACGTGSGISYIGAIDDQAKSSDGAVISGSYLYLQTADTDNPGLVSTDSQTFAGDKAFQSTTNSSTAFQIQNSDGYALINVDTLDGPGGGYLINNTLSHMDNYLQNPGFEAGNIDGYAQGWWDTVTAVNDSSTAHSGNYYATVPLGSDNYANQNYAVTPGEQIYYEGWVRHTGGTQAGGGGFFVRINDKDGNLITFYDSDWTDPGTTWTKRTDSFIVPAGGAYMQVALTVRSADASGSWYFDDLYLSTSSQRAPYLFQNAEDSTTALQVQTAAGDNVLTVDTTNSQVTLQGANSTATFGSELIDNGGATTCSGWGSPNGHGPYPHTPGSTTPLTCSPPASLSTWSRYQVVFTASSVTAGEVTPHLGDHDGNTLNSNSTDETQLIETSSSSSGLSFIPSSDFAGAITVTSIQEITHYADAVLNLANSDGSIGLELRAGGSGLNNSFVGDGVGTLNTTGYGNSVLGYGAFVSNTTGYHNSAVGEYALYNNIQGSDNNAVGYSALQANTSGYYNNAAGSNALANNTTGYHNSAFGTYALYDNIQGHCNNAFGTYALQANVSGIENEAFGDASLSSNTSGRDNVAIGDSALSYSNGNWNTSLGAYSLFGNLTGSENVAIGDSALSANTTGNWNTAIGSCAGHQDACGSIYDGFGTLSNLQNATMIGALAQAQASDVLILGGAGDNAVNVGIGTTSPTNLFSVSPVVYQGVTASMSGNTITGSSGTYWQSTGAVQPGMEFIFATNGDKYIIQSVNSETSLTATTSGSEGSQQYRIHNPAFYVSDNGSVGIRNFDNSATAFQVQNVEGSSLFTVDANNYSVVLGSGVGITNSVAGVSTGGLRVDESTTNIVTNPSFEADTSGWGSYWSGALSQATGGVVGQKSLQVTTVGANGNNDGTEWHLPAGLSTGNYALSFYIKSSSGTPQINCGLEGATEGSGGWGCWQQAISTTWTRVTSYIPVTAWSSGNSSNAKIVIKEATDNASAITYYVDGVQLENKSVITGYTEGTRAAGATVAENNLEVNGTTKLRGNTTVSAGSSTTAFQIQDANGNNYLLVNTSGASVSLGNTGIASTIQIGNTTGAIAQTTNIGNNATGSSTNTVVIGSTIGTSATTIESGSGTLAIGNGATAHTIAIGSGAAIQGITIGSTNSTSTTTLQGGVVTTVNNQGGVIIGGGYSNSDTSLVPLRLDSTSTLTETGSTCTSSVNGGSMYYNSNAGSNAIRACINGSWEDLMSTSGMGLLAFGVVANSGSNPGDLASLVTPQVTGPCKVSWASDTTVTVAPCVAYSGGRKVIVSSTTLTLTTTVGGSGYYENVCLTGTNGAPAMVGPGNTTNSSTIMPTFSATNPILCLATIMNGDMTSGHFSGSLRDGQIWDTRTFTDTLKEHAVTASALGLGYIAQANGTGVTISTAAVGTAGQVGVVVASNGSTSTTNPNVIIATSGPAEVAAAAGTAGEYIVTSTSSGYAATTTTTTYTMYAYLGMSRTTFIPRSLSNCISASSCVGSLYTELTLR